MNHNLEKTFATIIILFVLKALAFSQPPSHDPTQMVKDGDRYYIYTTGDGIWNMSADNSEFTSWRAEDPVFPINTWPQWIDTYVSGFGGTFWAPGIIYMDGEWHIYYSCSTFGSQYSTIGLATTPALSGSGWTDQGMVVYSRPSLFDSIGYNVNAIDPDLIKDKDGRVWMLYGSYWDGIVITELDSTTGKPIDPWNVYHLANGNPEAGYMMQHGDNYYLFFNRGACCQRYMSTYRIYVGRSDSPTGPFYDKDSIATNQGGGNMFLHSDGRIVGPGHFGFGEGKLTFHYYDGVSGAALLKIGTLEWDEDGWPKAVYSRVGGVEDGNYVISNKNSGKVLDLADADTIAGTNVVQMTETGDTNQHWSLTYLDDGYYKISPVLSPDKALEVVNCTKNSGGNVQIGVFEEGKDCQLWYIARMGSYYRIMSKNSEQALEIASAITDDGANAQQWPFNEHATQQWQFKIPEIISDIETTFADRRVNIYPNPSNGDFNIDLTDFDSSDNINIKISSMNGAFIYDEMYHGEGHYEISLPLKKGVYIVSITSGTSTQSKKLLVK